MPKPSNNNAKHGKPSTSTRNPGSPGAPARPSRASGDAGAKNSNSKKKLRERASRAGRSRNSSANKSAALEGAKDATVRRQPSRGPRLSVGTALCAAGFDERALAGEMVDFLDELKRTGKPGTKSKLLFDVLKECSRHLDNSLDRERAAAPVFVQLVHTVSRPPRVVAALPPPPIVESSAQEATGHHSPIPTHDSPPQTELS